MGAFEIGKYIKEFRERRNISQEDLSENLCAVSTLSRIERGIQYPSRSLLEAFFDRLGYKNTNIQLPLSKPDFRRSIIEFEITNKVSRSENDFLDLLNEYKNIKPDMDILETQFYAFFQTLHKSMKKECSNTQIHKDFLDVIHITIKDYQIDDDISSHLLTKIELSTLLNIARTEFFIGNIDKAISLMEQLYNYYNVHEVSGEDLAANLPVILFNLSTWYGRKEMSERALELSNEGIRICSKYGKLHLLPYLIFNKGYEYMNLKEIEKGTCILTTAINLMIQTGKEKDAIFAINSVKEKFNIDIPSSF